MNQTISTERVCASLLAAALSAPLLLLGCAHDKAPGPRVAEPLIAPEAQPRPIAVIEPPPSAAIFVLSQEVRQKCDVPETPARSPQFDFDHAELRDRGKDILDRIAACMTEGGMKDRGITLVGHTDPRGADSYNINLGMERAKSARDYLTKHGVATSAVQVESRGEEDATGAGPEGWQRDRHVDIEARPDVTP